MESITRVGRQYWGYSNHCKLAMGFESNHFIVCIWDTIILLSMSNRIEKNHLVRLYYKLLSPNALSPIAYHPQLYMHCHLQVWVCALLWRGGVHYTISTIYQTVLYVVWLFWTSSIYCTGVLCGTDIHKYTICVSIYIQLAKKFFKHQQ